MAQRTKTLADRSNRNLIPRIYKVNGKNWLQIVTYMSWQKCIRIINKCKNKYNTVGPMKRLALKRLRFTRTNLRPHHYHKEAVCLDVVDAPRSLHIKVAWEMLPTPLSRYVPYSQFKKKKKEDRKFCSASPDLVGTWLHSKQCGLKRNPQVWRCP